MNEKSSDPRVKEWINKRVDAVLDMYGAFEALTENGIELEDRRSDCQLACPFHGPDRRPSSRYYAPVGKNKGGNFHCFTCKLHLNSIALHAKFKNIGFMDALKDLERRFKIKIPMIPEGIDIPDDSGIKRDKYISKSWNDVPKLIEILENKLKRIKSKCSMRDYVKFCKAIDEIQWDYDRKQGSGHDVVLKQILKQMEDVEDLNIDIEKINAIQ